MASPDFKKLEHLNVGHIIDWHDIEKVKTKIPVLEQIKRGSEKPTVFAPFMGEFGFFINTYLRYIHYFKSPKKIVCCRQGEESLFPSADEFFYDWHDFRDDKDKLGANIPARDKQYRAIYDGLRKNFVNHHIQEVGHEISYRFVQFMPIPIEHFCEDIKCDVIIGPRNRARDEQRNYPKEKWQKIVNAIISNGFSVGVIGQESTSYNLSGVSKYSWNYDRPIDAMLSMLRNCRLFIGTDTGTSHVATMCNCPMIIFRKQDWSTDFVPYMKQQNDNLMFMSEGWNDEQSIINKSLHILKHNISRIIEKPLKQKICLHIPIHISNSEHRKMFKEKKILFEKMMMMDIDVIFTLDKCDGSVDFSSVPVIDMRSEGKSTGIVKVTQRAISYFKERYGNNCFMVRTGQDVKINLEGLWNHIHWLKLRNFNDKFIAGRMDSHNDIFEVLKEINIHENKRTIQFVQGNFMSAPMKIWDKYYNNLPSSVVHYKDDSCMSFCLERDGGRLEKIEKFWDHNPQGYFDRYLLEKESIISSYKIQKEQPSDVKDVLKYYEKYAKQCKTITEFRDRQYLTTLCFLHQKPKKLSVYNYEECIVAEDIKIAFSGEVFVSFSVKDSLTVDIEKVDLLHLDTFHNYERVYGELNKHHLKVKKFILIHDTETFKFIGSDGTKPGLKNAIDDFIFKNKEWQIEAHYKESNGLTVLSRVNNSINIKKSIDNSTMFSVNKNEAITTKTPFQKIIFYHLFCGSNYEFIHNRLMARIISNNFFDDCVFYISIVGTPSERLIWPKNYHIKTFNNLKSEMPAFDYMFEIIPKLNLQKNDVVGYFHCKGSSKNRFRKVKGIHDQDTLESFFGIQMWTDLMSYFLLDEIDKYICYIQKYGSVCVFPIRHLYGESKRCGSIGNFWWCSGDVANSISKTDYRQKDRHYFEHTILEDLIVNSVRPYKSSFYIHDGRLNIYHPDENAIYDAIYGSFSNDLLINLINIDLPYDNNSPSVGILLKNTNNNFEEDSKKFLNLQRFKNVWIGTMEDCSLKFNIPNIFANPPFPCPLIWFETTQNKIKNINNYYFLDHLVKKYKNSSLI